MRRSLLIATMVLQLSACSQHGAREQGSAPAAGAAFIDKVWTVVDAPGGPGDLYVFLSDGTFVKTAREAVPHRREVELGRKAADSH
jgi:nitrous oxide reductase